VIEDVIGNIKEAFFQERVSSNRFRKIFGPVNREEVVK
jgi:rRNA processing protein Gar1